MSNFLADCEVVLNKTLSNSGLLSQHSKHPGYIIAGFLVGPHFSYLPTIVDHENIDTFAEIGVIMLLFSLGLEFSFKKTGESRWAGIHHGRGGNRVCRSGRLSYRLFGWLESVG